MFGGETHELWYDSRRLLINRLSQTILAQLLFFLLALAISAKGPFGPLGRNGVETCSLGGRIIRVFSRLLERFRINLLG